MSKVEVRFGATPELIELIEIITKGDHLQAANAEKLYTQLSLHGPFAVGMIDGRPVAAGGLVPHFDGVLSTWFLLDKARLAERGNGLTPVIREWLVEQADNLDIRRVHSFVPVSEGPKVKGWMEALGFDLEATLEACAPDGDMWLFKYLPNRGG